MRNSTISVNDFNVTNAGSLFVSRYNANIIAAESFNVTAADNFYNTLMLQQAVYLSVVITNISAKNF